MQMHNAAVVEYCQPREAGDYDLVDAVRNSMLAAGISQQQLLCFDNNQYIVDARTKKPEVQRYLLNRYWNIQLLSCSQPSIDERFCLIPNGDISDWLRLFEQKVLPFIVKNSLPITI